MSVVGEIIDLLRTAERWRLLSHVNPDGDTLGCCSALAVVGRSLGKTVDWCGPSNLPGRYAFLPEAELYRQVDCLPNDGATLISLDVSTASRTLAGDVAVNVDHHPDNENFGRLNLIDAGAAATAELVWPLVRDLAEPVPPQAAEALLVALMTDTGHFRFPSVTPRSMTTGAALIEAGARPWFVDERLNCADSLSKLHLWGRCASRVKAVGSDAVISWVTAQDFAETGASLDDTDELVNQLTRVRQAGLSVLAIEEPTVVRCSLRSRGERSARDLAARWGGGGHTNAAGCRLPLPLGSALAELEEALLYAQRGSGRR